jgi:phosphotriesterase-related protein
MSTISGKVQSVLGPMEPSELGFVHPHEHLFVNLIPPNLRDLKGEPIRMEDLGALRRNWLSNPENLFLDDEDTAINEMRRFGESGGGTIVDQTIQGLDPDPEALARVSRETGVHIVAGSGFYQVEYHPPELAGWSKEEIAERILAEISEGIGDTGIKAGLIGEIGLSWPVHENEDKVLRGAVQAQRRSGASLSIHPGRSEKAPFEAMRVVSEEGGDPARTVMCHVDRTLFDVDSMIRLARTGCYLEFDLFGQESSFYPLAPIDMPNDAMRINSILGLMDAGYLERILVSQDICAKHRLTRYGGEGYAYLLTCVLPLMRQKGMSDQMIDTLVKENPARVLTLCG